MLRNLVLGLAGVLTLAGAVLTAAVGPAGLSTLVFGLLLLIGTLFERVRYKRLAAAPPDARFRPNAERFVDDITGEPVTVHVDPNTGERAYVRE